MKTLSVKNENDYDNYDLSRMLVIATGQELYDSFCKMLKHDTTDIDIIVIVSPNAMPAWTSIEERLSDTQPDIPPSGMKC